MNLKLFDIKVIDEVLHRKEVHSLQLAIVVIRWVFIIYETKAH